MDLALPLTPAGIDGTPPRLPCGLSPDEEKPGTGRATENPAPHGTSMECGPDAQVANLTGLLRRGEELAWRQFHAHYAPRLLRYLTVLGRGDEDLIRDALQQTLLRVVRHIRVFTSDAVLWSWLTVLARSACADEIRRRARRGGMLRRWGSDPASHPPPSVSGDSAEATLMDRLDEELERLPVAERELLRRKYLGGETVQEISAALGLTPKAVESRLVRARAELRSRLLARLRHET